MSELDPAEQRRAVRERYARLATEESDCCGGTDRADPESRAEDVGYSDSEIDAVADANLGLGCGNPTAIASLSPGEHVLDLGSGAGFDCFLAAEQIGERGRVVGVDMTPEMIERARKNVERNDASNVEFRLGEIEHLPIADETIDVVISNCVINLSPNKPQVFSEAFRALRPGGRVAVSDVVLTAAVPDGLRADPESVSACVAGASRIEELREYLDEAGFVDIAIEPKAESESFIREWDDELDLSDFLVSASIEARKPD